MKKRDPTHQLPSIPKSTLGDLELTDYELDAINAEREKSYFYRLALLENSQDLIGLLLLAKDRKMESLISQFVDGSLLTGTLMFFGAGLLGVTLAPALIGVGFIGGGLISCWGRD
jgi:hypothetical protein